MRNGELLWLPRYKRFSLLLKPIGVRGFSGLLAMIESRCESRGLYFSFVLECVCFFLFLNVFIGDFSFQIYVTFDSSEFCSGNRPTFGSKA